MKHKIALDTLNNYRGVVLMVLFIGASIFFGSDMYGRSGLSNSLEVADRSALITYGLEEVQGHRVTGTVVDGEGIPLPGASVLEQGTSNGAITDFDGNFALTVSGEDATLTISFVGFVTQEVAVEGRNTLTVTLVEDAAALDEVVVIGYGTQKKSDLTGAVSQLDAEDFQSQPITQVSDMLAGTVAGFYGNQGTGAAGGASLEIRGPTSLTGGTAPLIVLDGAIFNGSMADINPNDIATVDVLKDASSAAVYGAKAANGVIIISTKQGITGEPVINFNTKLGVSTLVNKNLGPHEGQGYEDFRRDFFRGQGLDRPDWFWNDPNNLPEGVSIEDWRNAASNPTADNTEEYLSRLNFQAVEKEVYLSGEIIDWRDEVFQEGVRQDYDVSVRGGTERLGYFYSLGYVDNQGIILGDEFQAIRARINLDFEISDWLSVGTNTQFSTRDDSSVPASLSNFHQMSPYARIYDEDGSMRWFPNDYVIQNPLLNYAGQERLNESVGIFSNLFADVSLPFGINYRLSYQPRFHFEEDYNFWGSETYVGGSDYSNGFGRRVDYKVKGWMVDNILSWNREIGIHTFDVTLLYNAEQTKTFRSESSNENFRPNEGLGFHGLEFGSRPFVGSNDTQAGGNAIMGRINYTLLNRYLFTASVRRDGYSAFGVQNNKATFPAAAVGWRISEEDFFSSNIINNLKLRFSWGINGNRDIGIYSALAQIGSNNYYDGTNLQTGVFNNTLANPDLRWEKTEAFNLGVDMALFKNRIDLSAEFYKMTTTDLLMSRQLPELTGFSRVMSNIGELQNYGMDATLNTVNISQENFSWRSSLIFSMNRNEIIELFGDYQEVLINGEVVVQDVPDYINQWFPGQAIDRVWDYELTGIWQLDEAALAEQYGMRPGDYKAVDVNGDGIYEALIDKQFIGYTRPRHRLGLRNDFSFLNNFTASIFVRADLGHIRHFDQAQHEWSTYDRNNYWNIPYWTPTNGNNEYPRLAEVRGAFGGGLRVFKPTSFVRIQDISLSYNVPQSFNDFLGISSTRFFISARNAFTFTDWPGWDPESGDDPMPKTFTAGFNIGI